MFVFFVYIWFQLKGSVMSNGGRTVTHARKQQAVYHAEGGAKWIVSSQRRVMVCLAAIAWAASVALCLYWVFAILLGLSPFPSGAVSLLVFAGVVSVGVAVVDSPSRDVVALRNGEI